jgi:hypothetical protein
VCVRLLELCRDCECGVRSVLPVAVCEALVLIKLAVSGLRELVHAGDLTRR